MNAAAISKNNTVTMNKVTLAERFKKYFLDNASYFAAAAVMQTGNSYGAAQIMRNK